MHHQLWLCKYLPPAADCACFVEENFLTYFLNNKGYPDDRSRVPALVKKAVDVCKSLINSPKTDSAAVVRAVEKIWGRHKESFPRDNEKVAVILAGQNLIKKELLPPNLMEKKQKKKIKDISCISHVWRLMLCLTRFRWSRNWYVPSRIGRDIYFSGLGMLMEDLLTMSITMRNHVFSIKGSLYPLREITLSAAPEGMSINAYTTWARS